MQLLVFVLIILSTATHAKADSLKLDPSEQRALDAIQMFSEYANNKDSLIDRSQLYYQIRDNAENKGLQWSLVRPLNTLYKIEQNPKRIQELESIYWTLQLAPPAKEEQEHVRNPHANRDLVMKVNECMASCIGDVVSGIGAGATLGGALGTLGGPAGIAAGAAGGATIGGAIGGLQCSVRKECNENDKKMHIDPTKEFERTTIDIKKLRQQRDDMTVNGGRKKGRG